MSRPVVHVVHCVDSEGPLYESLEATFDRLRHYFHLELEPDPELLLRLQRGQVALGGLEAAVQKVLDPQLLAYNDTWDKVDAMLERVCAPAFRQRPPRDSRGRGWVFNWFCVDHVEYELNLRRRDMGYHNIFDHYRPLLRRPGWERDGLHFHYHPQAFLKQAHLCATHWFATSHSLFQVLARRIIDRLWFPAVNRPGFQVNRPDSHWFLEQYIPFDYASLAMEPRPEDQAQFDFSHGRSGDWRRAPITWEPYHPSHDDYQVPGGCRRWIARCLNVGSRIYNLELEEVRRAFREAREGKAVVMAFADHDFRDLGRDVEAVRGMLQQVAAEYPEVEFRYCEAAEAMRSALGLTEMPPCELELELVRVSDDAHQLHVRTHTPPFGPQPFLAIKTVTDTYYHDNLDFQEPGRHWTYVFDRETLPLKAVEAVGVAANNAFGVTTVSVIRVDTGKVERRVWNQPRKEEA